MNEQSQPDGMSGSSVICDTHDLPLYSQLDSQPMAPQVPFSPNSQYRDVFVREFGGSFGNPGLSGIKRAWSLHVLAEETA